MKYHTKHVEQLTDINKLYTVAPCWITIAVLYDARPTEHKTVLPIQCATHRLQEERRIACSKPSAFYNVVVVVVVVVCFEQMIPDSIPGPFNPQRVTIPTELPRPAVT